MPIGAESWPRNWAVGEDLEVHLRRTPCPLNLHLPRPPGKNIVEGRRLRSFGGGGLPRRFLGLEARLSHVDLVGIDEEEGVGIDPRTHEQGRCGLFWNSLEHQRDLALLEGVVDRVPVADGTVEGRRKRPGGILVSDLLLHPDGAVDHLHDGLGLVPGVHALRTTTRMLSLSVVKSCLSAAARHGKRTARLVHQDDLLFFGSVAAEVDDVGPVLVEVLE